MISKTLNLWQKY